ncbi:hypothetical protein LC593_22820 [Nostoc sp. CHAB 5844]|nr:hypothetical protein [Nostoc sp. CHAB 5844]
MTAETTISIPVDATTAQAYNQASTEAQRKIQILLQLRMCELLNTSHLSLRELMDEIGAEAEAKGLTPEILETLLSDE